MKKNEKIVGDKLKTKNQIFKWIILCSDMDEADGVGRSIVRKVRNFAERIRNPSGQSKSESVLDSGQPPITVSPGFIKGLGQNNIEITWLCKQEFKAFKVIIFVKGIAGNDRHAANCKIIINI